MRSEVIIGIVAAGCMAAGATAQDQPRRAGLGPYVKASGLVVFQQDSELRDSFPTSLEADFDVGAGFTVGVGWAFDVSVAPMHRGESEPPPKAVNANLALELEYAFATVDIDEIESPLGTATASGDEYSNSFMGNVILEVELGGGFALYGGGGAGVAISSAELSVAGVSVLSRDQDTTFAWQALGGLKYQIGRHWAVYGGVRYFDAGDVDFDGVSAENQYIAIEAGFRFYF